MNQAFFSSNRQRFAKDMTDNSIFVAFAGQAPQKSADMVYPFTPNRNFYYLTGIDKEQVILLMTNRAGKVSESIFVERPDPIAEKWTGKKLTSQEATEISGIHTTYIVGDFHKHLSRLLANGSFDTIYLDLEQRSWESSPTVAHQFATELRTKFPFIHVKNAYPQICEQRTVKAEEEVSHIRRAIEITKLGIENMMKHAHPGVHEYELEAHFDFILKSFGTKDHAFSSIVAGGSNATVLHYEDNNARVEDNELVLIDLGAQYGYYNGDISRTFPVNGRFTDRQKTLYNIVLKAQAETFAAIQPGVPYKTLNETTKRVLAEELIKIGLIQDATELSQYYYHGVSHHLGLDTHDVGRYEDAILQSGMVLTVEPGLYIAEEGIGIRIEDNVLVTEDGYQNLSHDILKTVDEIERFMTSAQ